MLDVWASRLEGTMAKEPEKVSFRERLRQFGMAFTFARRNDKFLLLWVVGAVLLGVALTVAAGLISGKWLWVVPIGLLLTVLLGMIAFSRRVAKATYNEIEGKPGAAAAVIANLRGGWRVTPAAAFTPQQDLVHRVVGRPGVVLIIEGSQQRLRNQIAQEKKRVNRIAPSTPIYELVIGDGEGEVSIRDLQRRLVKLPRNLTPREANSLHDRLAALASTAPPIPKAPMPKNMRMPKGPKAQRR